MGGGAGIGGGHFSGGGRPIGPDYLIAVREAYRYPEGWDAEMRKTLKQELSERGIEPLDGDERLVVIPEPNVPRDRAVGALILAAAAIIIALIAASAVRYAIWEGTPDPPGLNCEGADHADPRCQ